MRPLVLRFLFTLGLIGAAVVLPPACTPAAQAQAYAQPTVVKTGNWPAAVYTGDVNGDGFPDLIYIDGGATPQSSTTHVLLNDGKGNFTLSATLNTAGDSIAIADFDGDGKLDIAWIQPDPSSSRGGGSFPFLDLYLARGTGSGQFSPGATIGGFASSTTAATAEAHFLTAARLRNAGPVDLVYEDVPGGLLCSANTGGRSTFYIGTSTPLQKNGSGPIYVTSLTSSGLDDLIVADSANQTADVYLGNSAAPNALIPLAPFHGSSLIASVLVFDGIGYGDPALIAEGANGRIDVFPGNGDGTFQSTSISGTGTLDGLSGNGGHLIAVNTLASTGQPIALASTPIGISSLLGNGTQYLGLKGIYNAGPGHTSYAVADFNGDGILDLAVDSPEGIAILYGNADGSFQTSRAFAAGQPALSIATGQFTTSGNLDAVVSTAATQAQVLLGQGDGRLLALGYPGTPVPTTAQTGPPGLWSQVAVGDFNGDGIPDLLLTADGSSANLPQTNNTLASGAALQTGLGKGLFANPITPFFAPVSSCGGNAAAFYGVSAVADFNADGAADFANRDDRAEQIFAGSKLTNSFQASSFTNAGCAPSTHNRVVAGDLSGDGLPDLVEQTDGHLQVQLNGAGNAFTLAGDLSVDGALTTPGQRTAPDLSQTFGGPSVALGGNYAIGAMLIADLDRDGNTDLLVTYHNLASDPTNPVATTPNFLYIWFGSGGGKFLTSAKHPVNPVRIQLSRNYYQLAVADLNGDGIPDLILSDGFLIDVQNGLGDGTFGPEQHFLAGAGINGIATGSLRPASKVADLLVANGGATLSNPVANHETLTPNADVNTGGVTVLLNAYAQYTPTGTISATPEPSTAGSSFMVTVTFKEANVAAPLTALGSLTIDGTPYGGTNVGGPTIAVESDFYTVTGIAAGAHQICGLYAGDTNNSPVTVCLTHTVTGSSTTSSGTLSASPEPSAFESPFTITASVASTTGTVQFAVDGTALGAPVAVSTTGQASITDSATLLPGSHTLTATYFAANSALAVALTPATHTVSRAPTSVILTPTTPLTVYYGQDIDGTFTIHTVDQFNYPYTGNYSLQDNGADVPICTNLPSNQPCPYGAPILLDAGPHSFVVTYLGDPINAPSSSPAVLYTVLPDLTAATLTTSANPSIYGSVLTLTATITGNIAIPNGTVQFLDGVNVIGTATLNAAGVATFQTSTLAPGQHSLSVNYPGTIDFNPASTTGNPLVEVIVLPPVQLATAVTLSSSLNPAGPTQTVIFTAAVTVPGPFPIVPTGTVNFTIDGKAAGSAPLDTFGLARLTAPQLAPGPHTVVAMYAGVMGTGSGSPPVKPPSPPQPINPRATTGTQTLLPSTSDPLIEIITYPLAQAPVSFTMEISPTPVTLGVGRYALLLVKITDLSGFNQPVALSCSGLPNESTCTFAQPTVAPGGGSTTLQLQVSAPHDCGDPGKPYFLGDNTPPTPLGRTLPYGAGAALAGVVALGFKRRRRDGRTLKLAQNVLLLVLLSSALYALSGCGHCTDLGTRPGNYSFTVTGVAQGSPVTETQSQTIGLTVTIP